MRFVSGLALCAVLPLASLPAYGQFGPGAMNYPPASLSHEFLLVLSGAIFGGLFAPILQALDFWLGITPGAKQQRENYEVQREIAASLRHLVDATRRDPPGEQAAKDG